MNAGPVGPSSKYTKTSAIPLYIPMKIENMEFSVTVVGETTKINALLGDSRIFFYLNQADHLKAVENNAPASVMELISNNQNPFCFIMRGYSSLGVRYIPHG